MPDPKKTKSQYKPPEIKKIRLDAEVLLVAGCKLTNSRSNRGCTNTRCATPNRTNGS